VFGNQPREVARMFRDALGGPFRGCFSHVVFAITDPERERPRYTAFREVFEG
jgi:uncharacterized protein (TIGR02452 family)